MDISIENIAILLIIAALTAIIARRVHFPYTIGLVLAGVVIAFIPFVPHIELTKELIFKLFLPPLIFEAALFIRWKELQRNLTPILTFATVGVLISALITAAGMVYFAGWSWQSAILFGTLIAATDPVSVIATFKEAGVHGRLRLLVEAESIFNDGTAAVAFSVALSFALGQSVNLSGTIVTTLIMIFGGIFFGLLVAGIALWLAGNTDDHLTEVTLTAICAYASFLLAEHFHTSGVLATLACGLLIGNVGSLGSFTDKGREYVLSFWEFAAFLANSFVFLLIGFREAHENFSTVWMPTLIAILFVLIGRAVAIYPLSRLFASSPLKLKPAYQHILFWGGLRGALALALALGLPESIPHRAEIVSVAFGVVAFSIFVQGLTITPLLKRLKEL